MAVFFSFFSSQIDRTPAAMSLLPLCLVLAVANAAKPNILLLFPDQWRYDWDGMHSDPTGAIPLQLPTVLGLAQRGTRFTQAYVAAPLCAPSRACLASGREYDFNGVPDNFSNDYPINITTFYSVLQRNGYWTMTTGKDDLTKASQLGFRHDFPGCPKCNISNGLFHQAEMGFSDGIRYSGKEDVVDTQEPHEGYGFWLKQHNVPGPDRSEITAWRAHRACFGDGEEKLCNSRTYTDYYYEDDFTAENAVTLLRRRPKQQPFFLQVSFPGPHPPFHTTADIHNLVANRTFPAATDNKHSLKETCEVTTDPGLTDNRCNYGAEIQNLDTLFAKVLAEVQQQGVMNNTIVCVSSDHGEMLGDHGDSGKTFPWQGSASVPLMCAGPGIKPAQVVSRPVGNMDLAATFIDYAGGTTVANMTSVSLRGLLEGRASAAYRSTVQSGLGEWRMVVQELGGISYKLICCKGSCPKAPSTAPGPGPSGYTEILIDVTHDPFDMTDLKQSLPNVTALLRPQLPPAFRDGCSQS
eukprot:m.212495 g.212495  ORF g.212495 m.212495 type:complete len:523 (+) comp22152_c0_seq3:622-2190(+)